MDWVASDIKISGVGSVAEIVALHRQIRAEQVSARLAEIVAQFAEEEVLSRLAADPRLADIVDNAVREALASVSDDRMELMMTAVRRGLEAHSDAEIDEGHFHTRTLCALEVAHLSVFRAIVSPRRGQGQMSTRLLVGHVTIAELADLVPGAAVVLEQILARLIAEGLVYRHETELLSVKITGGPHVSATEAGDRFAAWLQVTKACPV